jgi:chromosome segregation ATPase
MAAPKTNEPLSAERSLELARGLLTSIDENTCQMMILEKELFKANRSLERKRHDTTKEVNAEQHEGKKRWSNAEARRAEIESRLQGEGAEVAQLMAEKGEAEFSIKQAERQLKFHYENIDYHKARLMSLHPSIMDIQDFLFKTVKQNIAEMLMDKPEVRGGGA